MPRTEACWVPTTLPQGMHGQQSPAPSPSHLSWARGHTNSNNLCRVPGLPPDPAQLLPSPRSQNLPQPWGGQREGCWCTGCFSAVAHNSTQGETLAAGSPAAPSTPHHSSLPLPCPARSPACPHSPVTTRAVPSPAAAIPPTLLAQTFCSAPQLLQPLVPSSPGPSLTQVTFYHCAKVPEMPLGSSRAVGPAPQGV